MISQILTGVLYGFLSVYLYLKLFPRPYEFRLGSTLDPLPEDTTLECILLTAALWWMSAHPPYPSYLRAGIIIYFLIYLLLRRK